ncbi:flavodoxin family protein [uncultured Phycicoccus sp.]|uniref:flavodoxin family protein n=1 Tax=uncultured Phycicoccus sp. TaxID=661422 RepID=UPI00261C10BA|nr:flavodoxin family protein [uncultured Phycicoccus sp.]
MERALVVFESMFGQTETVARAVAQGVAEVMPVDVVDVAHAPQTLRGHALVLAGGPTHAFSMSRASTRREAQTRGATQGSVDTGLREWLEALGRHEDADVVTFDTRVTSVRRMPGSAARSAARAARRHGLHEVARPESFYVQDVAGPLDDGEEQRATAWGRDVARASRAHHAHR